MAEDRAFGGIVRERLIVADDQDVDVADCLGEAAGLVGVTRSDAGRGVEGLDILDVKPSVVIVARAASNDQCLQPVPPFKTRAISDCRNRLAAGCRGVIAKFGGDGHKGGRDLATVTGQRQLLNHATFLERPGEVPNLPALMQQFFEVLERFRARHIHSSDVIGDLDPVTQHDLLGRAIGILNPDVRGRGALLASGISPTRDASKNVQARDRQPHRDLDLPGIRPRQPGSALEHNHISARARALRIHNVEGHVPMLQRSPLPEPQRLVAGFGRDVNASRRVRGEGGGQIKNAITLFVRAQKGQEIAQSLGAECFKPLRHERPIAGVPRDDVVLPNRGLGSLIPNHHHRTILAQNNAVIAEVVLRLDAHGVVVRFDNAIRIEDVDQHLFRPVRTHARKAGCKLGAFIIESVTLRAVLREYLGALGRVARPDHLVQQPCDQRGFLLPLGTLQFLNHARRAPGHFRIRVRPEPVKIRRTHMRDIQPPLGERVNHRLGPLSAFE